MAPSVGLETTTMTTGAATKKTITAKGGGDMFREWTRNEFPEHGDSQESAKPVTVLEIFFVMRQPAHRWMDRNDQISSIIGCTPIKEDM
jgi:hypothetical protein